jgi:multidrug efflux system membrane fusion protein
VKVQRKTLLLVAIIAAIGGAYFLTRGGADKGQAKIDRPVPVSLAVASAADMPVQLETMGRAEAWESVTLKARIDAPVLQVAYREGQHVKKGELLVKLDPANYAAQYQQAEGSLVRDKAQQAKAAQDLVRYTELRAKGFISEEKLNEIRTNAETTAATAKASGGAAELARLNASYATVRAPFDGVVGARLVSPGTLAKNNDTVLAVVNRIQPLYVTFNLPEKHLPTLKAMLKKGALPVRVTVPGSKGEWQGEARFLDNAVDASTGTIQMKAVLPNADEALSAGQFLNVSLVLETLRDAITIPSDAIQQGQDSTFVFVVDSEGKAQPKKVKVLTSQRGLAAIAEGLAVGDTVVTDGQLRLFPGAKVEARSGKDKKEEKKDGKAEAAPKGDTKPQADAAKSAPAAK